MAGAGYKLFQTGDVLTAAQVNTYLNEQTVMVFANAAARTSALTSVLAEGMVSYLQDTNAVEVYNGSAWVGVSGTGDVTEVQAGTGISVASGTGPIPVVTSTVATTFDAKGDLVVGTGADTFAKLSVGTNGHNLVADSGETTGLKYQAPTVNTVIDAKGDLLVGTADNTIARLAVGTNDFVLTAASGETTGLKWAAVGGSSYTWTSYTPTVTSSTGTITSSTAAGQYVKIGKLMIASVTVNITNAGTGAGGLRITVPENMVNGNVSGFWSAYGIESSATGKNVSFAGSVSSSATYFQGRFYDFTTCIATNNRIEATFIYEVA